MGAPQVQGALQGRAARLKAAGREVPRRDKMLPYVVHVSPDQRKVFVGDERDVTRSGTRLMSLPRVGCRPQPVPALLARPLRAAVVVHQALRASV